MIFDITSPSCGVKTLAEIAHKSEIDICSFLDGLLIMKERLPEFEKPMVDSFCEYFGVTTQIVDTKDLSIAALHYTSNDDECCSLKTAGLRDLKYILSNNTPLPRFLSEYGFAFDIENGKMIFNSRVYDISFDQLRSDDDNPLCRVSHKIYYDYAPTSFICVKDVRQYSTVSRYPEFIYNISQIDKSLNSLSEKWENRCKSYELKFAVPIGIVEMSNPEDYDVKNWLIELALNVVNNGHCEEYIYAKRGDFISKDYFLDITEMNFR
jgi:hypothetical protein